MLKGEEDFLEENEEGSLFETENSLIKEPLPVIYNAKIPIETFDFIVVDECHRSIYNIWRQVLEYFDSFLIGLTATPTKQTIGFFGGNLIQDYAHEQAVVDGVNVGYDVYRIETQVTKDGAKLAQFAVDPFPDYPQCSLRMARFRGITKAEFVDQQQLTGHAFKLLREADIFLRRHLPVAGRFESGVMQRIDEPLFPPLALREALVNAFIHRDLNFLRRLGLVEKIGKGRGAVWHLIGPAAAPS